MNVMIVGALGLSASGEGKESFSGGFGERSLKLANCIGS
jgi:hypothetical protein